MTYLYASMLRLIARHDARIPVNNGQYAYAAFLRLVEAVDPNLSAILHDNNSRKPFTVSPVLCGSQARDGHLRLRAGDDCWLRFTLLGSHLFKTFTQQFLLGSSRPHIRLGHPDQEAYFDIAEVRTTPGSHLWAGSADLKTLVANARVEREVTLTFSTPTSFKDNQDRVQLLPQPEFVFGNLIHEWLTMGLNEVLDLSHWINLAVAQGEVELTHRDGSFTTELEAWRALFARHVVVKKLHALNTRVVYIKNKPFPGFTGTVTFEILGAEPFCQVVNLLADCALYFGVGRKTTMGMGQCRRVFD